MAIFNTDQDAFRFFKFIIQKYGWKDKGLPVTIFFEKETTSPYFKIKKDKLECIIKYWTNGSREEVYFETRAGARSYFLMTGIPWKKIIKVEKHPDLVPLESLPEGKYTIEKLKKDLINFITPGELKTLVLNFTGPVFLDVYSLVPISSVEINVSVGSLSFDKGKTYELTPKFYTKGKNSKTYYFLKYFPIEKLSSWETKETSIKRELIRAASQNNEKIEIEIRSTKTKTEKQIVVSNKLTGEDVKEGFHVSLVLRFDKQIQRNHSCCLICGTKLRNPLQIYVQLLQNGKFSDSGFAKIENHFQFFPVGSECLGNIPEKYRFEMQDLKMING